MASAPDLAEATQVFLFSLPTEAGALQIGWVAEGSYVGSLVALQLALAPVMLFGIGIDDRFVAWVKRLHHPDPRHHGRPAAAAQQQDLDGRLPLREVGFLL